MENKLSYSIIWGFTIVSSAFFARPLYNFVISLIPRAVLAILVGLVLVTLVIWTSSKIAMFLKANSKAPWKLLSNFVLSSLTLIWLFYSLELPEEKIHILLYASLGSLRLLETKSQANLIKIIAFVFTFSLLSESLQALIPGRFFDLRDLGIDTLSGVAGAALAKVFLDCDKRNINSVCAKLKNL